MWIDEEVLLNQPLEIPRAFCEAGSHGREWLLECQSGYRITVVEPGVERPQDRTHAASPGSVLAQCELNSIEGGIYSRRINARLGQALQGIKHQRFDETMVRLAHTLQARDKYWLAHLVPFGTSNQILAKT